MSIYSLSFKKSFLLFAVVPTALYLVYLLGFAQESYETEAGLIVRESRGGGSSSIPGIASALLGVGGGGSVEDAMILETYLLSAEFFEYADEVLALRAHFEAAPGDPFRRLGTGHQAEEFYKFMRKMISVRVSVETGILTLKVRAFAPEMARRLIETMVERSEVFIDGLNERITLSQVELARMELEANENRLHEARRALLDYQIKNSTIDPLGESTALLSNVTGIDSRLVELRSEQRLKAKYLRGDAFELKVLEQEISALESQRAEELNRLVSDSGQSMVQSLQSYERLKIEHEFSKNNYTSALSMVELALIEASRQEKFLLKIASPQTPEKAVFPRPVEGAFTIFCFTTILAAIGRMLLATIKDHSI